MEKEEIDRMLNDFVSFCERYGIKYTINRNPNEEEIKRIQKAIQKSIQRTEEIVNTFSVRKQNGDVAKSVNASD